jgi:hypothetical protein
MTRTLHATLADVVREVVKTDEGGFKEMVRMGITPPTQTMALTAKMRDALAAYDAAAETASKVGARFLIEQAHAALEKGNTTRVSSCLASLLLVLDYDAAAGPYAPEAATVQ